MDTIFALASAPGRAGVSVIRVSGPDAVEVCAKITTVPEAGSFKLAVIRDLDRGVIDRGLILCFAEGHSFTGEATVEFQVHGSIAVVRRLSGVLRKCGARDAEAGEFSRRALENGMMDLLEVEALADLIDAETEVQHRQAIDGISGRFRGLAELWREKLLRAMALTEATIDFADEEVPTDVWPEVGELCHSVLESVDQVLGQLRSAQIIRTGFSVAIVGKPNVGKSTLLNAIAGEEVAITSDV
ncbi:MAG: tRNA modification GTPase, partial [Planktomarina sp.]